MFHLLAFLRKPRHFQIGVRALTKSKRLGSIFKLPNFFDRIFIFIESKLQGLQWTLMHPLHPGAALQCLHRLHTHPLLVAATPSHAMPHWLLVHDSFSPAALSLHLTGHSHILMHHSAAATNLSTGLFANHLGLATSC